MRVGPQSRLSTEELILVMVLEKILESSLDLKEIKPVTPRQSNPEYSLEGLMRKLKLIIGAFSLLAT